MLASFRPYLLFQCLLLLCGILVCWSDPNCPVDRYSILDQFMYQEENEDSNSDGSASYYPEQNYAGEWYPDERDESMRHTCTDETSNPRGRYTSHVVPCVLSFHRDLNAERVKSVYTLSTACTDDNLVDDDLSGTLTDTLPAQLRDYIQDWPDECIGDFRRCYEIPTHERFYFNYVCRNGWQFPVGATHVAVDCTKDKAAKLEILERQGDDDEVFLARENHLLDHEINEMEKVVFIFLAFLLCMCLGCMCGTYWYVVRPYQLSVLNSSRSSERDGLVKEPTESSDSNSVL